MKKFEQMKRLYDTIMRNNKIGAVDELYVSAITGDFDRLFELSWKTMKEYMFKELGIVKAKTGSPREILGLAYAQGLINDEKLWLSMLNDRNDDSHLYKMSAAAIYKGKIEYKYLAEIAKVIAVLAELIPEETIESSAIPDALLAYAQKNNVSVYEVLEQLSEKHQMSMQTIMDNWEDTYLAVLDETDVFKNGGVG